MKNPLKRTPKPDHIESVTKKHQLSLKALVVTFITLLVLASATLTALILFFSNRLYPGIYISEVNLTGLTPDQAKTRLNDTLSQRANQTLTFLYQNQQFQINLRDSITSLNTDEILSQAMDYGHSRLYYQPIRLYLNPQFGKTYSSNLKIIQKSINQSPLESQILVDSDNITVTPSQTGQILDQTELENRLTQYLNTGHLDSRLLPLKTAYPHLSYQSALAIKNILDQVKLTPLKLTFANQSWTLDLSTLINILDLQNSQSDLANTSVFDVPVTIQSVDVGSRSTFDPHLSFNKDKLDQFFIPIAKSIDRQVQEPLFNFDGKRVTQFQPPTSGQKLDLTQSKSLLIQALAATDFKPITLPVDITEPKNKLTNELGIKELIGQGISNFAHSIPNRIYNLSLAASRINGVLIPPGETFSFVRTVGDISAASGYKQAYIIKEGRTILDDGGGVCQVSTTLFRAALNAGVPIPDRTAHAYRVQYYEQGFPPGLDATVFSPSVDFKFRNDTPANILIQSHVEGLSLYVYLYGTSDSRQSKISKPVILSQTPPLPEIRQDDPTLPKGTVKQVDFPAWGANVVFTRTVTRGGQTLINETYRSNYRPWQAVFLIGTKEG